MLREHGLDIPIGHVVSSAREAGVASDRIAGPVVLKGMGTAHKSDQGLVALGLVSAAEVEARAGGMIAPHFLVEEMIDGGVAEILVGVVADPAHGFVLSLGAGGVLAELSSDVQSLVLPVVAEQVEAALNRLTIAPILDGYRGASGVDRASPCPYDHDHTGFCCR